MGEKVWAPRFEDVPGARQLFVEKWINGEQRLADRVFSVGV